MIYPLIEFNPYIWFAGFALGFFFGNLVSLIKYIITAVFRWMRG